LLLNDAFMKVTTQNTFVARLSAPFFFCFFFEILTVGKAHTKR
jgi:hypothetical protein